ncbi:FAR1-related sequence 5-like protein [Tanacetum coccineum]
MFKLRHHWVKAYLKDTFFAGMTSGRSESIHSFFDGFVNAKTMLNEFVVQYDKAASSRRSAEKDQDFRTLNSKPTLYSNHPIEEMAATCYTRNIYDIFKKEWKGSFDSGHEILSTDGVKVIYRVGFLKGNKENWKTVEYNVTSAIFVTCSCARFETSGILCKIILYIMRRESLTTIPDHYIIPRWTMKATYKVGGIETRWRGKTDIATKEVTLLTIWFIRAKFNKIVQDGRDSLDDINKIDVVLNGLLEEQSRRKKTSVELNTNIDDDIPSTQQENISQQRLSKKKGTCHNIY